MDRPFVGYEKQYAENYKKIFKKTKLEKIRSWIDNFLYRLFLKVEDK
jgi:hypothetical protein